MLEGLASHRPGAARLPRGQHPSPTRTGIYDPPIFRSWDNSSSNTAHVRNLHRGIDPNVDERRRTQADETKDETTRARSGTKGGTNGCVPGPTPFPRPGRLARRVVGVNGGACAIAVRRREAPLTPATRRGQSPVEGAATKPLILGRLFRLVADRCDDLRFYRSRTLDVCGRLVLFRRH